MRIALITNVRDGKGLARDAELLKALLTKWGHECHVFDFRDVEQRDLFFTAVFHLEVVSPKALSWSDKQGWVPNVDWAKPEYLYWADAFRVVVAKTLEGERVLKEAGVQRVIFTGFESADRYMPEVPRERRFFHAWAGSMMKGTRQVLAAANLLPFSSYPAEWSIGNKIPDPEYKILQNRCLFHIQPSAVEGFGHVVREPLGIGAVLATLDAPPMNEARGIAHYIPARKVSRQYLADVYEAKPEAIAATAERMWAMTDYEVAQQRIDARDGFLDDRDCFRAWFREVLEGL